MDVPTFSSTGACQSLVQVGHVNNVWWRQSDTQATERRELLIQPRIRRSFVSCNSTVANTTDASVHDSHGYERVMVYQSRWTFFSTIGAPVLVNALIDIEYVSERSSPLAYYNLSNGQRQIVAYSRTQTCLPKTATYFVDLTFVRGIQHLSYSVRDETFPNYRYMNGTTSNRPQVFPRDNSFEVLDIVGTNLRYASGYKFSNGNAINETYLLPNGTEVPLYGIAAWASGGDLPLSEIGFPVWSDSKYYYMHTN